MNTTKKEVRRCKTCENILAKGAWKCPSCDEINATPEFGIAIGLVVTFVVIVVAIVVAS